MLRRSIGTASANPSDDICPVCKSNRYLNPNLTFLINPECYHTMCTSCVDRLFTSGPAPCPVAGCHKTLRKKGFHKAFFADLAIEREVDVRKRVGKVFNRRQDEFETLRDWNNYLETVEALVFDIVEGSEKERRAAEEALKEYAESNRKDIEESAKAEREEEEEIKRREQAEIEATRRRRIAALKEEQEEKMNMQKTKREVLDQLANGHGNAEQITKQAQRAFAQQADRRRGDISDVGMGTGPLDTGLTIRGLKKKVVPAPEKPYDPFGGLDLTPSRYVLQSDYASDWLEPAKKDTRHMAGGYSLQEYYGRTMFEAFSGLGVFIEDEVGKEGPLAVGVAAPIAGGGSLHRESDDVF